MKKIIKILSLVLVLTLLFSTYAFADEPNNEDPEKIDIGSDLVEKDYTNFAKTMYYEPRERINNLSFYYGGHDEEHRLSSIKDYTIEYVDNELPGTAKVIYTGVGLFTGTHTEEFEIQKMPIANVTTKASFDSNKKLVATASNGSKDDSPDRMVLNKDYKYSAVTDVDGNVTVTFQGIGTRYTGTCKIEIKAKDNPNPSARSYLKDVVITKSKNIKSKKIELKWKKIKNIAGYQMKYYQKGKSASAKKLTLAKTLKKYTIKKLKKKKTYYIKMRTYIVYNNKIYYGAWTKAAKVKIKK